MQDFVREHEANLLLGQARCRIEVDGAQSFIDGGYQDALATAQLCIFLNLERRHHSAQQRKAADEPAARALGCTARGAGCLAAQCGTGASCDLHRLAD